MAIKPNQPFIPDGRNHLARSAQRPAPKEGFFKGIVRGIKEAVVGAPAGPTKKSASRDAFVKEGFNYPVVATKNLENLQFRGGLRAQTLGPQAQAVRPSPDQCVAFCKEIEGIS